MRAEVLLFELVTTTREGRAAMINDIVVNLTVRANANSASD